MSLTAGQLEFDRVRCAWRPYRRGEAAEPRVRDWLQQELALAPGGLELTRDSLGRPRLGHAHAGHDASWSHSGEGLLMALGERVRIGCDLEWARPRPRALELARRYFAAAEADWLAELSAPAREAALVRISAANDA